MIEMMEMVKNELEGQKEGNLSEIINAFKDGRVRVLNGNELLNLAFNLDNYNEEDKKEVVKTLFEEGLRSALNSNEKSVSKNIQKNKIHNDLNEDLNEDYNVKIEFLNEGHLNDDLILNDSIMIEKGTSFKVVQKISEDKFLIRFGEHTVMYDGIKIKNPSITLRVSKEVYEEIAMVKIVPKYLKSLSLLTEKELITKEYVIEGLKFKVVSRENLVKQLMDEYNLYTENNITVQHVIDCGLTTNYTLVDDVMKKLGFSIVGEMSKVYLK